MKLLLENWRKYLLQEQVSDIYGSLYLFEANDVSKTSFYEAINTLSESNEDTIRFLESWEQSIDYMFANLKEQTTDSAIDDSIIKASTQAYMALQKLKGKAVGPVINVMKKLKAFEKQNPAIAKAIKFTLRGLALAAATTAMSQAMASGGSPEGLPDLASALSTIDPEVADGVAQVSQDFTPETAEKVVPQWKQKLGQVANTLNQSADVGLQKIAQAADNAKETLGLDITQATDGAEGTLDTASTSEIADLEIDKLTKTAAGQSSITITIPGLAELGANGGQIATDTAQQALAKALGTTEISAEVAYFNAEGEEVGWGKWNLTGGADKPVYATATTHSKGPTN